MDCFNNKTVLITGASSGIGEEFAKQLSLRGSNLILVARRIDKLNEVLGKLKGNHTVLQADISVENGLAKVIDYIKQNRIDILINNAGRGSFGYFEDIPVTEEQEMVRLNCTAPLTLAHAVVPQLKERRSGGIITLSSIAGLQPLPYMATYAATKAFDLFHSLGLRYELRPYGVRALAVCPGPVATGFAGVARVPGKWTGMPRDPVEKTVSQSLTAFELDKALVFPGTRAKLLSLAPRLLPITLTTWLTEKTMVASLPNQPT